MRSKSQFGRVFFPPVIGLSCAVLLISSAIPRAWAQSRSDWHERWEQALQAAKKEGRVVVWGPPGELIREAMTQGFKKAFPDVVIEYAGARGGEQAVRIKAERDGGVYSIDVFLSGTTTAITQMKPMQALDPIEPALIRPEVADPKFWREDKLEFADPTTRTDLVFSTMLKTPLVFNPKFAKAEELDELNKLRIPNGRANSSSMIRCLRARAT